ncbi:MAG: sigma-70 family RNA polymerase sigma factor, partial [Methylobacteriaceae bacterium]|nr:sigma-70 family RNA polymerase sigma factor [Methylobacteriaceae bacterium]
MADISADLATLLAAVARGDETAFQALYRQTSAKLLGVVLRIVRDRARAEDVVQEAYMQVWRGAASYSPEISRPMTWLISIARYRAIDAVRARREVALQADEDEFDPLAAVADPSDAARTFV